MIAPVRCLNRFIIKAQSLAQSRHTLGSKGVFLGHQVGDGSPDSRVIRRQISPLGGVTLQVLNSWLEGRVTSLGEGLQKSLFARLGGLWGNITGGGLARLGHQVGGAAFDGKKDGAGPASRQSIQQFFA